MEPESYPETFDDFLQWAAKKHDDKTLENILEPPNPFYDIDDKKLILGIASIVSAGLEKMGYPATYANTPKRLASDIPYWQEPEREFPYDALIVRDWLKGEQLVPQSALEGICWYLKTSNEINENQEKALLKLRDRIHDKLSEKKPYICSETTQTLRARIKDTKMAYDIVGEAIGLKRSTISMINGGTNKVRLPYAQAIDENLESLASDENQLPLTDIFWIAQHEAATKAWDNAQTLGPQIRVLREYIRLNSRNLADKVGMSRTSIVNWENEAPIPNSPRRYKPSSEQLKKLIKLIKAEEDALQKAHPDSFMPILDRGREATLKAGVPATGIQRRPYHAPREEIAKIVLLKEREQTYNGIIDILDLDPDTYPDWTNVQSVYTRHQKNGPPLTEEERKAATEALKEDGIDLDSLKPQRQTYDDDRIDEAAVIMKAQTDDGQKHASATNDLIRRATGFNNVKKAKSMAKERYGEDLDIPPEKQVAAEERLSMKGFPKASIGAVHRDLKPPPKKGRS